MKKVIIGAAIAAVLGIGGYLAFNKNGAEGIKQAVGGAVEKVEQTVNSSVGDIAEKQINDFVAKHKNQPIIIQQLQTNPAIQTATWTITDASDQFIMSQLDIQPVSEDKISIPLKSEIIRGSVDYKGNSYGFGQIITHPQIEDIEDLPEYINNETLSNTTYIQLNGKMTSVTHIAPIKVTEEGFDFKGITAVVNTSMLNTSAYDMQLDINGISADDHGRLLQITPVSFSIDLDEDGNYRGKSSAFTINTDDTNRNESMIIDVSEGEYAGIYQIIEGLTPPLSNGRGKYNNITILANNQPVKLTNVVFEGGFYDAGDKKADLTIKMSTDVDAESLKTSGLTAMMPGAIVPEHFDLNYSFRNIGYDAINLYYEILNQVSENPEIADNDLAPAEQKLLLKSLQHSGTEFDLNTAIKTEQGDANADLHLQLSEAGKTVDVDSLINALEQDNPAMVISYFEGKLNAKISKKLVSLAELDMFVMMFGAKEEGDDFIFDGELKDGAATLNGQPMM